MLTAPVALMALALTLAPAPDAVAAGSGPWRPAGLWGGDVPSLAIDPRDPDFVLAGTSSGQIFVSRNGGDSWRQQARAVPFAGWAVEALLFDPNHSRRVWAALKGGWEERGFVALSEDRGHTWTVRSEGLTDRQVYSLEAVPGTPGVLYAGTRIGVFATQDHGRSWRHLTARWPEIEKVTSLLVDRGRPTTIWAGTWRRAYRSDDAGSTWRRLDQGMALDSEVFSLLPVPDRPGEMWASTCGWVYRGSGGGESWERMSNGLTERRTPSFEVLPSGRLLAGTVGGVFVSDDRGSSWRPSSGSPAVALALAVHPERPDRILVGTEGLGILRSDDGGLSFSPANRGLSGLRVAALAKVPGEVLAGVHHAQSASGLYSSKDGGLSFNPEPVELPTILNLASSSDRVFAATEKGLYERRQGHWRRLTGLGERRIDEVVVSSGTLFARSGREVYEERGSVFRKLALHRLEPRHLALSGDTLWLTDRSGRVFSLPSAPGDGRQPVEESPAGILQPPHSGWSGGSRALWNVGEGVATRLWATGDPVWPLLVAVSDSPPSLVGPLARHRLALGLALRPRDLADALVVDGRLLVATNGFGVWVKDLPPRDGDGAAGSPVATAR